MRKKIYQAGAGVRPEKILYHLKGRGRLAKPVLLHKVSFLPKRLHVSMEARGFLENPNRESMRIR